MTYSPAGGEHVGPVQPSLHVGLIATPQINYIPVAKLKFQQSCCYWSIETSIEIESNMTS